MLKEKHGGGFSLIADAQALERRQLCLMPPSGRRKTAISQQMKEEKKIAGEEGKGS